MAQRILNVRIRPLHIAVLLGKNASQEEMLLSLKFLSVLWGGRYFQLLAADPNGDDQLTCSRLSQSRPDLVYGVGIDHVAWKEPIQQACQPRGFGLLESKYVDNLSHSLEEHVTAAHVLHHLRNTPLAVGGRMRALRVVDCDANSAFSPFISAIFGMHYPNVGDAIPIERESFAETCTPSGLIALHTDVMVKGHSTWLDLASHGLTFRSTLEQAPPTPTIVLVENLASDLALFWNLRQGASIVPQWVIPLPVNALLDPAVPRRLKEWLQFWEKRFRCETCRVTSTSVATSKLEEFATCLQNEVKGTMVNQFHAKEPTNEFYHVLPYESHHELTVELSLRTLTFLPPRPKLLEGVSNGSWIVELTKDVRSGRSVNELCLPSRASTFAVLNAPGPVSFPMVRIPRMGDGVDGINVHCSQRREVVRLFLPTGDEILEEVLREVAISPVADEKRACYRPTMRKFGGLDRAAQAFSGQRGAVLKALIGEPQQLSEIQAKARLGKGKLAELAEPEVPKWMLDHLGPVAKRVLWGRRRRSWAKRSPSTTAVGSLLEFWADHGIVSRQWRVGPCPACMGSFWEARLDISRPVSCPGCGNRLRLPSLVPMGYSLHRLIRHAIREGFVPVVLAGRFLSNLTRRGFLWLPGVKFRWNDKQGDLDILACCDGHIVVGECKSLSDTTQDNGLWDAILEQFAETIRVGHACRASFAVLAVMAESFPPNFQREIDQLTGPSMGSLLLNKKDLEQGYRLLKADDDQFTRRLSVDDLIVDSMPEMPKSQPKDPVEIKSPLMSVVFKS